MPLNLFQQLLQYLHFVDNNNIDKKDKLAKIKPIIETVRNKCVKFEPKEFHSIDKQIISWKKKFSSIRQYNPKKPKKCEFKYLVRAGSSGFMCDFYIYEWKNNNDSVNNDYGKLQKCSQVAARLTKELSGSMNPKLFLNNWISTLDLMLYVRSRNIFAVGTVHLNRLGYSMDDNKTLQKSGCNSIDHRTDKNSGIIMVKGLIIVWYNLFPTFAASNQ